MKFSKLWCCVFAATALTFVSASDDSVTSEETEAVETPATNDQTTPKSEQKIASLDVEKSSEQYHIGDMIELKANVENISPTDGVIYNWKVRPEVNFVEWVDGSKIFFGTGHQPTVYTIFLSVSIKSADQHQLHSSIIDVDVSTKNLDEIAVKTAVTTDFVSVVKQLSSSIIVDQSYTLDSKISDSKLLSTEFSKIKSNIDSGNIKDLDETLDSIRTSIDSFDNKKKWEPLLVGVGTSLEQESKTGSLDEMKNVSLVIGSISEGLKKIDK